MADLKESALSAQSDCKWVRALDANGNSIRISKEDLAEVLGELIGLVSSAKSGLAHQYMYSISSKYISIQNSQYTIVAQIPITCSGYILITGGIQASYSNNMAALVHVTCDATKFYARFISLDGIETELYYKAINGKYQLAIKDKSTWWHVCSTSFHPGVTALANKLEDISGWTKL